MAELNKSYKCNICGNVVNVMKAGIGELVCCGQPMAIVEEQAQATQEARPEMPGAAAETSEATPVETPTEQASSEPAAESTTEDKPEEQSGENNPNI